jgi:methyl-accepting chemotaxis protein
MPQKYPRKPIGNFFIKKDLQIRLILKIVLSVILATAVFAATLLLTYYISYRDAAFYQVTLQRGAPEIGDRLEIVSILLPSMLISAVVNVFLAICVGLYASRKYAVPIFKLERWAGLLNAGDMTAKLRFREKDEMKELSESCNRLSEDLRGKFVRLKRQLEAVSKKGPVPDELHSIVEMVTKMELESHSIEVQTAFSEISDPPSGQNEGKNG